MNNPAAGPKPGVAARSPGEMVAAFIERYVLIPEGVRAGQPLILEDFQHKFIREVYDNPNGTRVAILSMARKNAKTSTIAALVLAHLVGPVARLNGQIVSGALSRDQASLVYHLAEKMIVMNPKLAALSRPIASSKRIVSYNTGSEYKALAAEGSTAMGLSPYIVILDEIGQIKGPSHLFIDALTTSQGAHQNPMIFAISTQAPTDGDLFSIWIDDALSGADPKSVCHLYAAEAGCDIDDPKAWYAANPGLGTIRSLDDLKTQVMQAKRLPSMENSVRNLLLNQRVQRLAPFLTQSVWDRNKGPIDLDIFRDGRPVYGGLDLSSRNDLTGLVLVTRADDGRVMMHCTAWTPADTLIDRARQDRVSYEVWNREGYLRALPGVSLPYNLLAQDIIEIIEGMNLAALGYDRWRMDILMNEFQRMGASIPIEPFGMGYASMAPAVSEFEAYALDGFIRHGDNPVLTNHISNVSIAMNAAGDRKPEKAKSHGRIDLAVAALIAVSTMGKLREPEFDVRTMIG